MLSMQWWYHVFSSNQLTGTTTMIKRVKKRAFILHTCLFLIHTHILWMY
jgi:hypothetical protein